MPPDEFGVDTASVHSVDSVNSQSMYQTDPRITLDITEENLSQINDEYDAQIHDDISNNSELNQYQFNYNELQKSRTFVEELIPRLFALMTYIKYKSGVLRLCNKISNILIILFSSIITFIEALRANTNPTEEVNIIFTLITLVLGFIIALTASIVKFFNFQGKIERLGYLTNMLEVPYLDSSKLLQKIGVTSINDMNDDFVKNTKSEILKIIENYSKPYIDVNNILHPNKISEYMQRYNTQKKQMDDIELHQLNINNARDIERYVISLKDEITKNYKNNNFEEAHIFVRKLENFADALERLNLNFSKYRGEMNKLYTRDNINSFHKEIQKIEWYKCKNIFSCCRNTH